MTVLKWTIGLLVALLALIAVVGMSLPGQIDFTIEATVEAPAEAVYAALVDLKAYRRWEPFGRNDPSFQVEFEEPTRGVGAAFRFSSSRSAYGRLEIVEVSPPVEVRYETRFEGDVENPVRTTLSLEPISAEATRVTWEFRGSATANPLGRILMRIWKPTVVRIHEEGLASLDALLQGRLEPRSGDPR